MTFKSLYDGKTERSFGLFATFCILCYYQRRTSDTIYVLVPVTDNSKDVCTVYT